MHKKIGAVASQASSLAHSVDELGFLGFWSWDFLANTLDASEDIQRLFGMCYQSGALALPASEYELRLHPDDAEWVRHERPQCFGPSGHGVVEYRVIDEEGQIHWIVCHGLYETDHLGNLTRGRGFLIDVTAFRTDGNSCRTVPAPFPDPVKALVDSALNTHAAARQIGDATLINQAEALLLRAGRFLARDLAAQARAVVH